MEKEMKDAMMSWWEDEESKYIFENRLLHNESDDFIYIQNIVNRCVPELKSRVKHSEKEDELLKSLVPDYHLYLRHYSNSFTETVLYALP